MNKQEIYKLTGSCTNKEQIKSLLKGADRQKAFEMLAQRQKASKRAKRIENQNDDYLSLPLAQRAK